MTPDKPSQPDRGKPADPEKATVESQDAARAEGVEAAAEAAADKPATEGEAKPEAGGAEAARRKVRRKKAGAEQASDEAGPGAEPRAPDEETAEKAAQTTPKRTRRQAEPEAAADEAPAEEPQAAPARRGRDSSRRRNGQPAEPAVLVRAQARYVRTSARKARLVCDHIRGKDVAEARSILSFTPRAAAKPWLKLLESAIANAEHNHELVGEELRVFAVHADEGPTLKRYRPRAMGRATRIRKRTSHLTITLTPKES